METFLLNPNTAAQNPVSPQGASPVESETCGEFTPVMNEAVNTRENMNSQQDTASGDGAEQTAENFITGNGISEADHISELDFSKLGTSELGTSELKITETDSDETIDIIESDDVNESIVAEMTIIPSAESLFPKQTAVSSEIQNKPLQPQALTLSETAQERARIPLTKESPAPINLSGTENALLPSSKVETMLLQQIQQILDQGKNSGSISITTTTSPLADDKNTINNLQNLSSPLLFQSTNNEIQSRQVGVVIPVVNETNVATQKSAKLDAVHQNATEQFLNAKLGKSKTSNGEGFQQNNSDQKGTGQQNKSEMIPAAGLTPGGSIADVKPVESGFGQQLNVSAFTTTQSTGIEGKMAPGAYIPVPENEMVNNLIQRFNINPRLQTSKLTMQLHPAELGALKVDILVKDSSIKAHIVVQSPQVMETLEKNMSRLREVLQSQGFTVDSFEVSMEGGGGNQNELFQEHFNSQQQEFASNRSSSRTNESFENLLDIQNEPDEIDGETSGVNLTV